MKKITFAELSEFFREYNTTHDENKGTQSAVIVFKPFESGWDRRDYSLEECSYRVWNNNRRWQKTKSAPASLPTVWTVLTPVSGLTGIWVIVGSSTTVTLRRGAQ